MRLAAPQRPASAQIPPPGVSSGQRILVGGVHLADRYGPWRKTGTATLTGAQCSVLLAEDTSGRQVGVGAAFDLLQVLGTYCLEI